LIAAAEAAHSAVEDGPRERKDFHYKEDTTATADGGDKIRKKKKEKINKYKTKPMKKREGEYRERRGDHSII
jgi:hypothetical protein